MRTIPCDAHDYFHWDCDDCKNSYQRQKYLDVKDEKVHCKYCNKDVMKREYNRHTRSKFHQMLRTAIKSAPRTV